MLKGVREKQKEKERKKGERKKKKCPCRIQSPTFAQPAEMLTVRKAGLFHAVDEPISEMLYCSCTCSSTYKQN